MIIISSDTQSTEGQELTVFLTGHVSDPEVREAKVYLSTFLETNARNYESIVIDVSKIETVSSVVVALLLSGLRAARKFSCKLHYINLPEYLFNMARVGGVEAILLGND